MAFDCTRTVPDLALSIDRSAALPLGGQVQDSVRRAIRSGMLRPGERLPSTRQLAARLGVSRGLVVSAYEQLLAEGYVVANVGSGTRVTSALHGLSIVSPTRAAEQTAALPAPKIDFGYGVPDLRAFCTRDWLWALGDAAKSMPTIGLGDGAVEGDPCLREMLADYHRRVRGSCADPTLTMIVGGFRQGLNFVLAALVAHGVERIALEDPGPRDHDHIARRAGLRVSAVAVDDDGLRVDQLRASGARAVLVTPAHQCPTGAALGPARRHELMQWANEVDGVILEDDYDSEFRYDRQPPGALQGLAPDRVVALGSVSKTLAPALRIGWVFTPPRFRDSIVAEMYFSCRGVPQIDQVALARLIGSGRFDRHLRRMRNAYRQRRDALVLAVTDNMPGVTIAGLEAGHHALLRLPAGVDEERVVADARAAGIAVQGLGDYRVTPDDGPRNAVDPAALVIGFGNATSSQIIDGIQMLAEILTSATR